jgi:hypothetical protein
MPGGQNGNPVERSKLSRYGGERETASISLLGAALANGAILSIPNMTVLGTDSVGPSFTVSGNFTASDTISIRATGLVDLNFGNFTANAAGIITAPATTNTGNHPGETSPNTSDPAVNYAALLIGNMTLGFFQAFPSNAANGLGNPGPPTTLFSTATLGSIGFGAGLSNGTVSASRGERLQRLLRRQLGLVRGRAGSGAWLFWDRGVRLVGESPISPAKAFLNDRLRLLSQHLQRHIDLPAAGKLCAFD